jgi:hypothetical protein
LPLSPSRYFLGEKDMDAIDDEKLWKKGIPMEDIMRKHGIPENDLKGWEQVELDECVDKEAVDIKDDETT